ncbi:MAG: biotin transporter BioY [Bacillales bacterium]|nr:biotin transporter BioY [Mollicutes bacterium]MCI7212742.1 biotin transporter BioY [Bacillales bacterium]MDY3904757.1 biotin transporter BioY [Candidatus Enteromonas sp.]MCI7058279.1 biotin transporter BioY [Mollicutes bacterium]MDD7714634.1 biotin transporter BioY [Mollicutes bacterium]
MLNYLNLLFLYSNLSTVMENETKKSKKEVLRNPIVKSICLVGVFTALMCVLSPLSIPLDPVSITLATLVIYIIGATFDYKIAVLPVVLYLLLGMAGLPVFSKFQGGIQVLFGPTGGYLFGYIPCVFLISLLISKFPNKKWLYPIAMIIGTIVLYAFGTLWFVLYLKYDIYKALLVCVVPFLPGDTFKIAVACLIGIRLSPLAKNN